MDYLNIFLLGGATGIIFAIISMILISAKNSEIYPIGGFIPAIWMLIDLGIASQIIVAGILIIGGMTGFYLALTFWKERPVLSKGNKKNNTSNSTSSETINGGENTTTVKGKSLAKFL